MAETPRTRCWSIATSPRSPSKIPSILRLLQDFAGRVWNKAAQIDFARRMFESDDYEGEGTTATESDFFARDRVNRAPRTLGFVRLGRNQPPVILLAGEALLAEGAHSDLYLRQLLKWQYPSPLHDEVDYRELFRIRPFLEIIRLVRQLGYVTKVEMSLFAVPLIDWRDSAATHDRIRAFRSEYDKLYGTAPRRELIRRVAIREVERIWADDITAGRIKKREAAGPGGAYANFINGRINLLRDYADNAIRYFRATGLFSLTQGGKLSLLPDRLEEVDAILATFPRDPVIFLGVDDYYRWLGDPNQPALPSDQSEILRRQIGALFAALPSASQAEHAALLASARAERSIHALKALYGVLNTIAATIAVRNQQARLARVDMVDEILAVFERIRARDPEIVDRPIRLEWNSWRAFTMLDDAVEVQANFAMDRDGEPLNPAPGKVPDFQCKYDTFLLAVEVTLTKGARQYAAEGEPVERHVGRLQREARDRGDDRAVYGLFVAETLAASVVTHFWNLQNAPKPTKEWAGIVRVVPITLAQFTRLIEQTRGRYPVSAGSLHGFFASACDMAKGSAEEEEWLVAIQRLVETWQDAEVA